MGIKKARLSLVGKKKYKYNDKIVINIPIIKQLRCDDGNYNKDGEYFWQDVNLFVQTPCDLISELDAIGIDFEKLTDYDLFILMYMSEKEKRVDKKSILFDFPLWELNIREDENGAVLADKDGNIIINKKIYDDISEIIAESAGYSKTPPKKFGNEYAKKKRIERDYEIKKNMRKKQQESNMLDGIILRLVCNSNFPYDFVSIQNNTIYDIVYSLKQIEKDLQVSDLMQTRLVGNDLSKIPIEQLNRFVL